VITHKDAQKPGKSTRCGRGMLSERQKQMSMCREHEHMPNERRVNEVLLRNEKLRFLWSSDGRKLVPIPERVRQN
jgi:hypothetical protein